MRVLAIDLGERRCGLAVSDDAARVASPLKVLPSQEVISCSRGFRTLLDDYEIGLLVFGRPLTLAGEVGPQAQRIERQAHAVAEACALPLEFVDERLSSAEAKRILKANGLSERDMRGKVDMVAASLFLQSWLDARVDQRIT